MTKLSKETVLPLMAAMIEEKTYSGGDYDEAMKQAFESFSWNESIYNAPPSRSNTLSKKQVKARNKNKAAKKARKKNRK